MQEEDVKGGPYLEEIGFHRDSVYLDRVELCKVPGINCDSLVQISKVLVAWWVGRQSWFTVNGGIQNASLVSREAGPCVTNRRIESGKESVYFPFCFVSRTI